MIHTYTHIHTYKSLKLCDCVKLQTKFFLFTWNAPLPPLLLLKLHILPLSFFGVNKKTEHSNGCCSTLDASLASSPSSSYPCSSSVSATLLNLSALPIRRFIITITITITIIIKKTKMKKKKMKKKDLEEEEERKEEMRSRGPMVLIPAIMITPLPLSSPTRMLTHTTLQLHAKAPMTRSLFSLFSLSLCICIHYTSIYICIAICTICIYMYMYMYMYVWYFVF